MAPAFKGPGANGTDLGRWFEVNSFDIDLQGIGLFEPGIVKKAAFSPLTLTLDSNTALAPLLTMAATNDLTAIKAATLIGVKSDGQTVSYRLDLGTLLVTNVEDMAGGGLTVSLDFGQIKLWTFTQDNSGVISHANDFTWDVLENSEDVSDMPSVRGGGIAASPEPATYFMLIDGLNGGSTDSQHKGWFEISGFDFDLENPSTLNPKALVLGKPQFSSLNVTLPQEAGLADLMDLAATGELVKGVRIEGFTGGTTPAKVYELTLADVAATKVVDGGDGGYSLSLDYGKIALITKNEAGAQARQFSYDIETNSAGAFNPSSLALSPDSSGGPVTPAKYFLAVDGVKGDSLDANHKGWFEVSNFDIDLDDAFSWGPWQPYRPARQARFLAVDADTGQQYRTGVAAGARSDGSAPQWCDACRRDRRGPTGQGLPARSGRRAGYEGGGRCRGRSDVEPRLRQDRARHVHPERHGRRSARGAVRLRSAGKHGRRHGAERASERERRSEPAACDLFHAHRRGQRRLDRRAAQGLVRDHRRRPRSCTHALAGGWRSEFLAADCDPGERGGACRRDGSRRHWRARQRRAHRGVHGRHERQPRSTTSPSPT